MSTCLIVSLKFRAAHVSHLIASYKQMNDIGYEPILFIHKDFIPFLPQETKYITDLASMTKVDLAIFWFPSLDNIKAMLSLKIRFKTKILYVFHEPIENFSTYLKSGNSRWWTVKFFAKYYVGLLFLTLADKVLLPSEKAIRLYEKGFSKYANRNYNYLPLLYSDERTGNVEIPRTYFSYIGSINHDHAYEKYVDYIYYLFQNNKFPTLIFLIASWRVVPSDKRIDEMISKGRLHIVSGKPMTNEEINTYYAESILIWNAYNRSTQSGVLAKSFMFGTPGLVMQHNLSEFVKDGREVKAIKSNTDFEEMNLAVEDIIRNIDVYSHNARSNYERNYDYSVHNFSIQSIIKELKL